MPEKPPSLHLAAMDFDAGSNVLRVRLAIRMVALPVVAAAVRVLQSKKHHAGRRAYRDERLGLLHKLLHSLIYIPLVKYPGLAGGWVSLREVQTLAGSEVDTSIFSRDRFFGLSMP